MGEIYVKSPEYPRKLEVEAEFVPGAADKRTTSVIKIIVSWPDTRRGEERGMVFYITEEAWTSARK